MRFACRLERTSKSGLSRPKRQDSFRKCRDECRKNPVLNVEHFTMRPDGTHRKMVTHVGTTRAWHDFPAWSPDGTQIAFSSARGGAKHGWDEDIFTIRPRATIGPRVTRLTDNAYTDTHPTWSPDGKKVVFVSTRSGNAEIGVMNAGQVAPSRGRGSLRRASQAGRSRRGYPGCLWGWSEERTCPNIVFQAQIRLPVSPIAANIHRGFIGVGDDGA